MHTWARGLGGVGGVKAFWCGGVGFWPGVRGVIFSGDPYDFHMGPKRERGQKKPSNDV